MKSMEMRRKAEKRGGAMSLKREIAVIYIKTAMLSATSKYRDITLEYRERYGENQIDHISEMFDELMSLLGDDAEKLLKRLEDMGVEL